MAEQPTTDAPDGEPKKRPASQYYWGDWIRDAALRMCPLVARGLWHEMNCVMHQCVPYGHLYVNGRPMSPGQLANLVNISEKECMKLLGLLEDAGVFSRDASGAIFSRRMVRDEIARNARAEGGKGGAEHGAKGGSHGSKGGRPPKQKGGLETPLDDNTEGGFQTPQKPPPSSSSASSPSGKREEPPQPPTGGEGDDPAGKSKGKGKGRNKRRTAAEMTASGESFWAFWAAYPRKVGKATALDNWLKLPMDDALLATILAAIKAQGLAEIAKRENGRFVPHPAAWLNQRRWEDEVPAAHAESPRQERMTNEQLVRRDPRPDWLAPTGYTNLFEAENDGCYPHTAHLFRNGKRVTA